MAASYRFVLPTLFILLPFAMPGPAQATWPHDPNVNVRICSSKVHHQNLASCSDGDGGAIMVWAEARAGNYDIYAQRVDRNGVTQWTDDGVALCSQTSGQLNPVLCPDGDGGAIVVWTDSRNADTDLYAQRVSAKGLPLWTANGVALCTAATAQAAPAICPDGSGAPWSHG